MNWTKDWPNEEGKYWFYGWRFRVWSEEVALPELHLCKVSVNSKGDCIRVTSGNFMYKSDGAVGIWTKIDLPDTPTLEVLNKLLGL